MMSSWCLSEAFVAKYLSQRGLSPCHLISLPAQQHINETFLWMRHGASSTPQAVSRNLTNSSLSWDKCLWGVRGIPMWRSNAAQKDECGLSGASGVGVESLAQFRVKLALLWALGSGGGKPKWKATPMAKKMTETDKAVPRRRMSWETESSFEGLELEGFLVCSASVSVRPALFSSSFTALW